MSKNYYTFRVDMSWNTVPEHQEVMIHLASYIKANFSHYCIFKEIADITKKEHLQGHVGCKWSKTKARELFTKSIYKKYFHDDKYSLTHIKDYDKYVSYCCKQGDVWINNILTQEEINEINKKYENKREKVRATTFTQKCLKEYILRENDIKLLHSLYYQYGLTDDEKNLFISEKKKLLGFILSKLGNLVQPFDRGSLHKIYNGILNSILQHDKQSQKRNLDYWYEILN